MSQALLYALLAIVAGLVVGVVAARSMGIGKTALREVEAGITALCTLPWREFAHIIEEALQERGLRRREELPRADGPGFDLVMERGTSRYLVHCRNGEDDEVTRAALSDVFTLTQQHGANGAIVATTSETDASVLSLAAQRRIELLHGEALWRQTLPWVPHGLRQEVIESVATGRRRIVRISAMAGGSMAALLLIALVLAPALAGYDSGPTRSARGPSPTEPPANSPATSPAPAPAPAPVTPAPPMPKELTPAELETRRGTAVLEVRGLPLVENALWSTRSTMIVTLRETGTAVPAGQIDEICARLVQFEELRFTRLQIEMPLDDSDATPAVRWRQCR